MIDASIYTPCQRLSCWAGGRQLSLPPVHSDHVPRAAAGLAQTPAAWVDRQPDRHHGKGITSLLEAPPVGYRGP